VPRRDGRRGRRNRRRGGLFGSRDDLQFLRDVVLEFFIDFDLLRFDVVFAGKSRAALQDLLEVDLVARRLFFAGGFERLFEVLLGILEVLVDEFLSLMSSSTCSSSGNRSCVPQLLQYFWDSSMIALQ